LLPIWLSPCTPSASFVLPTQYLAQTINPTLAPFSPLYTLYCFENPNGERRVSREASGGIEPPLFVLPLILGSLPFGVAVPFCSGGIARSAAKPPDLAILEEQDSTGSGWQVDNTQEGDYLILCNLRNANQGWHLTILRS